ncbi:MAG TPA: ribosome silencing factor [Bacteroides sp.]|nr:ribosome silencing factor [Bacteroides sp.]
MQESEPAGIEEKRQLIIEAIREKKGKEIVTINLSKIENSICDCFIICHGDSYTQVDAITESVEKKLKDDAGLRAHHIEGLQNSQWVLMDFFDILVHVFQKDFRTFYNLEELWADGEMVRVDDR